MLQTIRFLCSVVAAFARLVGELRRKALIMAVKAASPAAGLSSATPLAVRRKAATHAIEKQQQGDESIKKKAEAWAARRRPARLVIPVADDAGEVAAGWGGAAAANPADVIEVEGEGFCVASRAGPRHAMEDAYSVVSHVNGGDSHQLAFYGVFDGHGGRTAVDFVSQRLGENVVSAVLAAGTGTHNEASSGAEHDAVSTAIRAAYLATDSELLAKHQGLSGGACATTVLVRNGDLYVAHVGDCRAVLSHDGGAAVAALSADHTCARDDERDRIERGGGYVSRSGGGGSGVWRVQGSLAVSRSFGDRALKRWVVAEPAVTRVPLTTGCEFLVVASDGLWDKVSNQEAVAAVARSRSRLAACGELVELARRRGSRDDVTVMVVDLERFVR